MIANITANCIGGSITAPPSKSMAHRAVLCAALAKGTSCIHHLQASQDVTATLQAAQQLGAAVLRDKDTAQITGSGSIAAVQAPINCCESGSTLRFLIPIATLSNQPVTFCGKGRLFQRPMGVYQSIFSAQGLRFDQQADQLVVQGRLSPGEYTLRGDVSSQFISGLLFALPLLAGDSTILIQPPFESRSYVELTLAALRDFGVKASWQNAEKTQLFIPGNQTYQSRTYTVEADYSQAAFFAVLGAICGNITINGLRPDSLQGDAAILPILARCGAVFTRSGESVTFEKSELKGTTIDLADCPDLGPILMTLGLFCKGETRIINAARLRMKESDRIAAMEQELRKFGANIESSSDTVVIRGTECKQPLLLDGHNDHRVVMSLAMAGLCAKVPVAIQGAQAVAKSWPEFFDVLSSIGATVEVQCDADETQQ